MNRQWGKRSDASQEDLRARIESVMDDTSMDVSRVCESSMDGSKSAIGSDLPDVPDDVLDIDAENMPPDAADSVRAKSKAQDAKAAAKRKKMIAVGSILGVVALASVAAVFFGGQAAPTPAEISQVRSQFAPAPEPVAPAPPAAPEVAILPAPPTDAAPQAPMLPGGVDAPGLAAMPMPEAIGAAQPPIPAPAPDPVPAPAPDAALSEKLAQTQARIAELEAQNRRLQEQRAQAPAAPVAPAAPAVPRVRTFGDDVYRIFPDGLVLIDAQGRRVGIEVGETMRRYGRLISVNAAERSFRTDRGIWRAPQ